MKSLCLLSLLLVPGSSFTPSTIGKPFTRALPKGVAGRFQPSPTKQYAAVQDARSSPPVTANPIPSSYWTWRGHRIRYQKQGSGEGPALLLVHGFGGNCEHWRRNLPELGGFTDTYAIDLLGYGWSDKPSPKEAGPPNTLYNFENWADQLEDFVEQVVKKPVVVVCNSVGGVAGLQVCKQRPDLVQGVMCINISLRMLHAKKQAWFVRPFVKALQNTLRETDLGRLFFAQVATTDGVRNVLKQAYHDDDQVTDELVECILSPGLQPGAVDVFLDFISYSGGPLPEELLPQMERPVMVVWGEEDPWEPIAMGRAYGNYPAVKEFVVLPGVGHCPQDEAPHLVNPLIRRFWDEVKAPVK